MYAINNISGQFLSSDLDNGLYIVIHNPNEVPPHILLIHKKKYYSLAYNKCVVGHDAIKLLSLFESKKTPLLLLSVSVNSSKENETIIAKTFSKYTVAGLDNTTCLTPIRESLSEILSVSFSKINFIFEMIPLLELNHLIKEVKQSNLESNISNATYLLNDYNQNDILTKIKNFQLKSNHGSTYTNKL
ncbi:MAG: hypothetical protein V4667_12300 [Bacteroidota bacterium]